MLAGKGLRMVTVLCAAAPAWAQPVADELVRLGSVATVAPLCGLRDEEWAFDLRRAAVQSATKSKAFDDQSLHAAPGGNEASAALGYAEMEALEDFAEAPARTCGPLAEDPSLAHADETVRAFRAQRLPAAGS